jgi:lysozyme
MEEIKMMRTGKIGKDFIKRFENFSAKPYLCQAGKATIGYGTTRYPNGVRVKLTDESITKEQAEIYFENDLRAAEKIVNRAIRVSLPQVCFDMLVSHTQNGGGSETLFRLINQNADISLIEDWWTTRYINANGVRSNGLIRRRREEFTLFKEQYVE